MIKSTGARKKIGPINWRQILLYVLIGVVSVTIPGRYQSWRLRTEYKRHYSKLLELPDSISSPKAFFARMPGVVGQALDVKFYQPDADDDAKLRAWFVKHDGFSEFTSTYRLMPKPLGSWEAKRGKQFLIMSRSTEDGWVSLILGERMSKEDAERDLTNFPWKSEVQRLERNMQ